MRTETTTEQIETIKAALKAVHVQPFGCESGDPKYNAQRNLRGKTHYVDDETLKWHKSRIVSSGHRCAGLVFSVTCSDALDMHNTKRGFRVALFDVFGTIIDRPDLEHAKSTSKAAEKAAGEVTVDLVKHYREALETMHKHKADELKEIEAAVAFLK